MEGVRDGVETVEARVSIVFNWLVNCEIITRYILFNYVFGCIHSGFPARLRERRSRTSTAGSMTSPSLVLGSLTM